LVIFFVSERWLLYIFFTLILSLCMILRTCGGLLLD
jgi:hypothetical protein